MPADSLKALMSQASESRLVLPDFQRDFVWKPRDTTKLIASILNNYPIGGLLLMENSGIYSFRPISGVTSGVEPKKADDSDTILVLDGQQRLTSCYRAFYSTLDPAFPHAGRYYFNYDKLIANKEEIDDIEGPEIEEYLEFERTRNVLSKLPDTAREIAVGLFPLDIVFQTPRGASYSQWLSNYSFSKSAGKENLFNKYSAIQAQFIKRFIERITGYQVHYEKITKDTKPDVICVVFETINNTGKRLTVFDLLVARCFSYDIKLRDLLDDAIESSTYIRMFDRSGEDICVSVIPKIIALMSKGVSKRKDIITLDPIVIKDNWSRAVDALERALEMMATRFGCLGERYIPFLDALPPIATILASESYSGSIAQLEKLSIWYWRMVFSQYFAGASETKVIRSYREWLGPEGWLTSDKNTPDCVRNFSLKDSVLNDAARLDSGIYRGVISLLLSSGPVDFGADRKKVSEVEWNTIEDHHIFPSKLLRSHGISGNPANTVLNRTPITAYTNQKIGDKAPDVYFKDASIVGPNGIDKAVLDSHAIPLKVSSLEFTKENYQTFLDERRIEILIRIEEVTAAKTEIDG